MRAGAFVQHVPHVILSAHKEARGLLFDHERRLVCPRSRSLLELVFSSFCRVAHAQLCGVSKAREVNLLCVRGDW